MADHRPPLPRWIYRQSAVLPFRWQHGSLQVLVITNRRRTKWIIPKGIVEPGYTPQASAAKEALEEAGVVGDVAVDSLGVYRRSKWGGICEITTYPMLVRQELSDWAEADVRRRQWSTVEHACEQVSDGGLRSLIALLPQFAAQPETLVGQMRRPEPPGRLVYLLRHAAAVPGDRPGTDHERALTTEGQADCARLHRYLSMADVHPDLVLCSTAKRARQTLDAILPAIGVAAQIEHLRGVYEGDADTLVQGLQGSPANARRVMVVGHNPTMRSLTTRLASSPSVDAPFPTAALAILEFTGGSWSDLGAGSCRLHSLVSAAELGATQ